MLLGNADQTLMFVCFSYVQSACKIFKAAEECRLDRDEEKAYVLYMKYLTVYDLIKKRPDFKQQQDFFLSMLGPTSFKKAIEEAEKLSESLKLRSLYAARICNTVEKGNINSDYTNKRVS
uniref:USP8 dimerisation domain-containing protein n=1 Tax=Sinocyclocheilus anshuiensis TaxID=1608454 RepID=A0A671SD24_9TELE